MKRTYILRANAYNQSEYKYSLVMRYGDLDIIIGNFNVFELASKAQHAMDKAG